MDAASIERVREILDSTGMKNSEIAGAIATTPDKLSKSLSGVRKFTTTELALLAELAGTTVEWILTGRHRASPAIAARTAMAAAPHTSDIETIARRFSEASDQLAMLSEPKRDLKALPPLRHVWSYIEQANELAAEALAAVSASGSSVVSTPSLVDVVEDAFSIDVAVTSLPEGLDGCSWQTDEQRLIMLQPTDRWARQRFTLAHELGHILAGDAQELIAEEVPSHSSLETEKRANSFAAAFLMPESEIEAQIGGSDPDDEQFMRAVCHFRVSPVALAYRLQNLRLLDPSKVESWKAVTAETCALATGDYDLVATERARSRADRIPPRLLIGHLAQYSAHKTSVRPLASLMDRDPEEIAELLHPVDAK